MPHPLDGSMLKVLRAREHLDALKVELAAFQTNPYRLVGEYDGETTRYVIRFDVIDEAALPPRRLGLIVGDVIHNLRSALDQLAWQLAIAGTGPGPRTQFPIFDDADEFRRQAESLLHGIPVRDRAIIERLQPHHVKLVQRAGLAIGRDLDLNFLLMLIGRLDNVDKHSILLPAVVISQFRKPTFRNLREAKVRYPGRWIRVENAAIFCELFDMIPIDPSREVNVEADPPVTIVFGDPTTDETVWTDRRVAAASLADLFAAADAVDDITGLFMQAFD